MQTVVGKLTDSIFLPAYNKFIVCGINNSTDTPFISSFIYDENEENVMKNTRTYLFNYNFVNSAYDINFVNLILNQPTFFKYSSLSSNSANQPRLVIPVSTYDNVANHTKISYLIAQLRSYGESELDVSSLYHISATCNLTDVIPHVFITDATDNDICGVINLIEKITVNQYMPKYRIKAQYFFSLTYNFFVAGFLWKNEKAFNNDTCEIYDNNYSNIYCCGQTIQPVNVTGIIQRTEDYGLETFLVYLAGKNIEQQFSQYLGTVNITERNYDTITFQDDDIIINFRTQYLQRNIDYTFTEVEAYYDVTFREPNDVVSTELAVDMYQDFEINYEKGFEQNITYT